MTTGATKYGTPMPVDAGGAGGAVAMYMAMMPDAGPVLRYMAVMPPDAGVAQPAYMAVLPPVQADYMAVFPVDAGRNDGHVGVVALYAAPVPTKS